VYALSAVHVTSGVFAKVDEVVITCLPVEESVTVEIPFSYLNEGAA